VAPTLSPPAFDRFDDRALRRSIKKNWRARTGSNRQPSVSKTDTLRDGAGHNGTSDAKMAVRDIE
jgi:hypothetical protein